MTKIKNKTVLVTGGANGIGKLMGLKSLKNGAKQLVIWDIDEQALNTTAQEFADMGYTNVTPYIVDVSDFRNIDSAAAITLAEVGTVDVLFNNAGIVVGKSFAEHTAEDIERTIQINVSAVMHVARVFLPNMLQQKSGHIVNIASAAGFIPNPNMSVYASSKWAVLGWSESLRLELETKGKKMRVTTVCPSYINTGMFDGVKAPLLTPIMEPETMVNQVMKAVRKNDLLLLQPTMVKALPLLRGILPTRVFDFIGGQLFGVYKSMDKFKGHNKKEKTKKSDRALLN